MFGEIFVLTIVYLQDRKGQFFELDVPNQSDADFKRNFRVTRETFQFFVVELKGIEKKVTRWREPVSLPKRIAIALYVLGSSSEMRTIMNLFGVGESTVRLILVEFCEEVKQKLLSRFIDAYPPTQEKINEIVSGFQENWGFPQTYGCVDGCHIEISPPAVDAIDYRNYKGFYSLNVLAACDYRYRITYVNVGAPGKVNDSSIFEQSQLKRQHVDHKLFYDNSVRIDSVKVPVLLLGDGAFRLSQFMMKPFPFTVEMSEAQKRYNYLLSRTRRVIENVFGHLVARWRILSKALEFDIDNTKNIIICCCVLHNICNTMDDDPWKSWISDFEAAPPRSMGVRTEEDAHIEHGVWGKKVRETLANHLSSGDA